MQDSAFFAQTKRAKMQQQSVLCSINAYSEVFFKITAMTLTTTPVFCADRLRCVRFVLLIDHDIYIAVVALGD